VLASCNHGLKDPLIAGQTALLQMLDGVFTQALADEIQGSELLEDDKRDPFSLANCFVEGRSRMSESDYSIGGDESGWDHHFTPQLAFLCIVVWVALFPDRTSILVGVDQDSPIVFDSRVHDLLESLPIGGHRTIMVQSSEAGIQNTVYRTFTRKEMDVPSVLRRVSAGAYGTDAIRKFGGLGVPACAGNSKTWKLLDGLVDAVRESSDVPGQ